MSYLCKYGKVMLIIVDKRCLAELRELSSGLRLVGRLLSRIIDLKLRLAQLKLTRATL